MCVCLCVCLCLSVCLCVCLCVCVFLPHIHTLSPSLSPRAMAPDVAGKDQRMQDILRALEDMEVQLPDNKNIGESAL